MDLNKSAGNDIVALKVTDQSRAGAPAFYSKILSVSERALYDGQVIGEMSFVTFVWLLWSVKESVFKYLKRHDTHLVFYPSKIVVRRLDRLPAETFDKAGIFEWGEGGGRIAGDGEVLYGGLVVYGSARLYFRSRLRAEWVAAVVCETENFEHTWWGVRSIGEVAYAAQSSSVRAFVMQKLYSLFSGDDLRMIKDAAGCPVVSDEDRKIRIPVSLAHHDRFVAYSFSLPPGKKLGI
ncbi:MAG: 4'-phosphopantetheinyl transferase superfamily protein [Puia sp.]|nr:4'-phosphopantetheinyl transferase superfamily protein [Puia sp.]